MEGTRPDALPRLRLRTSFTAPNAVFFEGPFDCDMRDFHSSGLQEAFRAWLEASGPAALLAGSLAGLGTIITPS